MRWAKQIDGLLLRQASKKADSIRAAFNASVNIEAIVSAWESTHPAGGSSSIREARAWARIHVTLDSKALADSLAQVYATGYVMGQDVALSAYAHAKLGVALDKADDTNDGTSGFGIGQPPSGPQLQFAVGLDWSAWEPGSHPGSALVRPKGGLAKLLNDRGKTIKGLDEASLDRVGTRLADALERGLSGSELAKNLAEVFDNAKRAMTVANTEMARAMSAATVDSYRDFGVQQIEWRSLDTDDECLDNDEGGPINLGEAFPSGDTEPPAHPNCRCSLLPVIDMGDGNVIEGEEDSIEMALKPTMPPFAKTLGVPGPLEVERAKSRLKILPNPNEQDIKKPDRWVESPWQSVPMPTVDPKLWDDARVEVVTLADLFGTDVMLRRKNVKDHIENMGQAIKTYRSFAMVVVVDGKSIIVDGHHRLCALWLLGIDRVPVWLVGE